MLLRDKVYVYGDCAINVDPSAAEISHLLEGDAVRHLKGGVHGRNTHDTLYMTATRHGYDSVGEVEGSEAASQLPDLGRIRPKEGESSTNEKDRRPVRRTSWAPGGPSGSFHGRQEARGCLLG